jgi:DNA-binding Lrp family transcriptional regulator
VLLARLERLLDDGLLSRFGPMYHAERLGGALTLAALRVPVADFDAVAAKVNAHPEVAHNYAREHEFNMWFVLGTETPERIAEVIAEIERETGLTVYNMPKLEEFFVGLHFELDTAVDEQGSRQAVSQ